MAEILAKVEGLTRDEVDVIWPQAHLNFEFLPRGVSNRIANSFLMAFQQVGMLPMHLELAC